MDFYDFIYINTCVETALRMYLFTYMMTYIEYHIIAEMEVCYMWHY